MRRGRQVVDERQQHQQAGAAESHSTITRRRSQRSSSAPPNGASRNPGSIRAVMTSPTPYPNRHRSASARIASSPIQSPRLDTHCAPHNAGSRGCAECVTRRAAASATFVGCSGGGTNGACSLTRGQPRCPHSRPMRRLHASYAGARRRSAPPSSPLGGLLGRLLRGLLRRSSSPPSSRSSWRPSSWPSSRSLRLLRRRFGARAQQRDRFGERQRVGSVPRGTVAFVVPSVTYGPKRPSSTRTGTPLSGCAPNSAIGGFAGARAAASVAQRCRAPGRA